VAIAGAGTLAWGAAHRALHDRRALTVVAAMWLWLCLLFYHVNPEYFVLLLPVAAAMPWGGRRAAVVWWVGAGGLAWSINVVYGAARAGVDAGGLKGRVARLLDAVLPVSVPTAHVVLLSVFAVVVAAEAMRVTRRIAMRTPD